MEATTVYRGYFVSGNTIGGIQIFKDSKAITVLGTTARELDFRSLRQVNGKTIPAYPNDSVNTYTLKLVAGTLTWVQDT